MASSCMSTCINDVRVPVRATYVNLYKWPESDAEFVRSMTANGCRSRSSGAHARAIASPRVVDSISCRQNYLRSYTFSRKEETVHEKITSKCFRGVRERVKSSTRRPSKSKSRSRNNNNNNNKKWLVLRRAKDASCDALLFMFRGVLSCTSKVDDDHGEIDHKFKRIFTFN
ncbi:hypothetical protein WN944_027975 [Citrus x changshan-huyou]|uniref:Uncharacterized protein n=1 Tax=Citrus x changshan-huyou TaxID=2935761 RepID=A0AAP0LJN7_9ROSI